MEKNLPYQMMEKSSEYADSYQQEFTGQRIKNWNQAAARASAPRGWSRYYHSRLEEIYRSLIPAGQRVIEFGCGNGDLLAALRPAEAIGVDFSPEMVALAQSRHPGLNFYQADVHDLSLEGTFDTIILSDLVNDLWDVQKVLEQASRLANPHTRLILNYYSRVWEFPLAVVRRLGMATPVLESNWLTVPDISNLLVLAGFESIRNWQEILFPLPIPLLAPFLNRFLVKIWPFHQLALTNFTLARLRPQPGESEPEPVVTVVVPARNEAGNIKGIIERVPQMGSETEIFFVEGHSTDETYATIQAEIANHPGQKIRLMQQTGAGKGDAVRLGFAEAAGSILMILDADLTVPPETLPQFYQALVSGKGDMINGVRLVYPMEDQAMRGLNFLGNKFFSVAFSWVLGQPIKDTLCGTKVLWKEDYNRLAANRAYFGDFDPFGDFDLIFGAVKLNLKILDLPIRYRERKYGTTNIQRWKHGWMLIRMLLVAASRLKFV
jgi:SAM-dependent methyltransferase